MELNIYQYSDYRTFLRDYYEGRKKKSCAFSYAMFARKLGISTPAHIFLIISGNRNLTKEHIPQFATALGLTKKQQQYFDAMVCFNQAKTPESKRYYLELLQALRHKKTGVPISDEQYACLSKWFYPIILELVNIPSFKEEAAWIRKQLYNKVSHDDIGEALSAMQRAGLLKRARNGRLIRAEANLTTEDEVANIAAYSFHQQMISHAKDVLKVADPAKRQMSGITMAISERQFKDIQTKLRETEDWITQYLANSADTPETVYHLNILLFPAVNDGGQKGGI